MAIAEGEHRAHLPRSGQPRNRDLPATEAHALLGLSVDPPRRPVYQTADLAVLTPFERFHLIDVVHFVVERLNFAVEPAKKLIPIFHLAWPLDRQQTKRPST